MNKIYVVSLCDVETYIPTYLSGPEVDDFDKLCNSLINKATSNALDKCSKNIYDKKNNISERVHGDNILQELIKLLINKGYKEIKFDEYKVYDSSLKEKDDFVKGTSVTLVKKVIKYNEEVCYKSDKKMYEAALNQTYKKKLRNLKNL